MGKTSSFTANAVSFTAVTCLTACRSVTINEDIGAGGYPSTDLLVAKLSTDTPKRIPSGSAYSFDTSPTSFHAGEVAGFVKTVAGSTTIAQDEASW